MKAMVRVLFGVICGSLLCSAFLGCSGDGSTYVPPSAITIVRKDGKIIKVIANFHSECGDKEHVDEMVHQAKLMLKELERARELIDKE